MYSVEFRPKAAQDFESLDAAAADRILKKLRWLAEQIQIIECQLATGPHRPVCTPIAALAQYASDLAQAIDTQGVSE